MNAMKAMKAWQVHTLGQPSDALVSVEVPIPEPAAGQILVKVLATALNFPDVLMCMGMYQIRPELPFTPGVELCGEVVALGPEVTGFAVGDRVIGNPALPHGGLAEYALMQIADAFAAPESLDDASASMLHIAYQTGWFALHRRANLKAGETLLVHAGVGGVGSAAVQLGKAAGARVIAVVGGASKAEVARKLGADVVIDRKTEDVIAAVKAATGGRGADVIYDPVGGDAYAASAKCVAFEGRILVIGFAGGTVPSPALNHALVKNYSIVGVHWGLYKEKDPASIPAAHAEITKLVEAGAISPLVGATIPLSEAPAGLMTLASGENIGRVVVVP